MTDYLLDTNILILAIRGVSSALDAMQGWVDQGQGLFISVLTRTEIMAGMHPHEEVDTVRFLDSFVSLPIEDSIADEAGRFIYRYARQGIQLSFPDVLIAATALQHDLILVTTNPRHFPMPELRLRSFR